MDGTYKSAGTFDTEERALKVAQATERHARLQLAETSPADTATVTLATYMERFLSAADIADIEANSKETYARHLTLHVIPYIGKQRVAEVSRETIHRLLTVVPKEKGASQTTILHTRTALSAMLQMAWDNGYRKDNPVRGIKLKGVPAKPIIVATKDQFLRAQIHRGSDREVPPHRGRFLTREYTKNGAHRRFKVDHAVSEMVREHVALHRIGPGQVIFRCDCSPRPRPQAGTGSPKSRSMPWASPVSCRTAAGTARHARRVRDREMPVQRVQAVELGLCARRKRRRTGRSAREWSPAWRNDPTEYLGADVWRRIWNTAVGDAGLPFPYTPYQVRHTHASWPIDQGVDLARVQYRLGHGDLQATTRYVKILDEEDPKAADVISAILGDVA